MITVAGMSPSLDLTYVVDDLQLGRIHRPSAMVRCAGGKSLNLARAACTVGADVHLVGIFAGSTGRWLADQLTDAGIGVSTVTVPGETRTCVSIGSQRTGELTELYPYAETVTTAVWHAFTTELAEQIGRRPGWLAISGLTPAGAPPDGLAQLIQQAKNAGARVAIDTHGAALGPALEARPELTKINRSEAAELLGVDETTDLAAMAQRITERTGGAVVLTDGADGAQGLDPTGGWRVPAYPTHGGYPVGSGDSFLGGLVAALDRGEELAAALRWAAACGTANALVPGAAVFGADEAERIFAELEPMRLD